MSKTGRSILAMALLVGLSQGCTLAVDHFHQVTFLRGKVVGSSWMPFRWLRQSFSVADATLTLYEYRFPAKVGNLRKVAVVTTDNTGTFDFGSIPKGHYSLVVGVKDSDRMGAWFAIEITDAIRATKSVRIDVSPINPDCTGGHEFIETKS